MGELMIEDKTLQDALDIIAYLLSDRLKQGGMTATVTKDGKHTTGYKDQLEMMHKPEEFLARHGIVLDWFGNIETGKPPTIKARGIPSRSTS
jgi:hypothetical protein